MIIISCPRGYVTGGTELLHQLGYKLNLFGFDAYISYYGENDGKPATHPYFEKYNVPVVQNIEDAPGNILVYPEMMALTITDIQKRFPKSKHVLWWLSVDNAQMTPKAEKQLSDDNSIIHMVQSYYAMDYVQKVLAVTDDRLFYLSDYINYSFLNVEENADRDNTVLFNPRKGFERTVSLIKHSDFLRIKWRELAGIAPEEIPKVLKSAKVYIDFGNHPGKDRFPREAVACGCRLITGKRGSAAFREDVPIPECFKISDNSDDSVILEQIYSLIDNYNQTGEAYKEYLEMIREEFHTFEEDVLKTFSKIMNNVQEGSEYNETELRSAIIKAVTEEDYKNALHFLTTYRINKYPVDDDILILEGYTRLGIGEEQVALYLMNKLLKHNEKNYEAYLIKARAIAALHMEGAEESLDRALMHNKGTDDEAYIREVVALMLGK